MLMDLLNIEKNLLKNDPTPGFWDGEVEDGVADEEAGWKEPKKLNGDADLVGGFDATDEAVGKLGNDTVVAEEAPDGEQGNRQTPFEGFIIAPGIIEWIPAAVTFETSIKEVPVSTIARGGSLDAMTFWPLI